MSKFIKMLITHLTSLCIMLSLTLAPISDALANQDKADQQDQETSKGLNDKLQETGKKIIKDAAVSTAKAIAVSAASTAAKSAGSFGIGGALDGLAKAKAAVQVGIETATAAKNAKAISDSAKTMPLIVSIIMGLTGIVAMVKCKKASEATATKINVQPVATNIPAPSFYLWALSSVAYMVSEIVHFIKFKQLGRKVASMSLGSDSKEQSQALKQQLELLKNTKDLAKKKLTWQQIVMAGYIASEVAAIAELAIWIATATAENNTRFIMQCNKDEQKKEEDKNNKETQDKENKSCGPGGLRGIASDGLKAGGNSLKGGVNSSVGGAIDSKSDEFADKTVNKKKYERQARKEKERLEKERLENEKEKEKLEKEKKAEQKTESATSQPSEEDEGEDDEGDGEGEEEEEEFISKFHFKHNNFQAIAHNHYKVLKHNLEVEIQSQMIMNLYMTANTNPLIKTLIEARSSTDAYYLFDEWNREHANAIISASIDDYKIMRENSALEDALDHDEANSFGKMVAASLSATQGALNFFPSACAEDASGGSCASGGGKKAGAAIKEFLVDFVLDRIFGLAGSFKDKGMDKLSEQMDKKIHGKNAALTEEEEEKIAEEEEALSKEADAVEEKISDIDTTEEDDKLEAIRDAREAKRATAAEEAADKAAEEEEADEGDDSSEPEADEEEEEEEISEDLSEEELAKLEQEALVSKKEKEEKQKQLEEEKKLKDQKLKEHTLKVEQDEIARQKYENSIIGKGKTKGKDFALEKADEGYGELEDLGRDKLKGLVIKDKKTATNAAPTNTEAPKTDVNGGVRDKTNADAKGLKGKITKAWTKVGEILEKFFQTEAKRMGLGAASILVIVLAVKDTKKNIQILEQQINDTQKIVDELDGIKSSGQLIEGKLADATEYGSATPGRAAASTNLGSNSAQGRLPYSSLNNVCFQGVGSQMKVGDCSCQASGTCSKFDRIKIDPGAFPGGVGAGYSTLAGVNDKLMSGNYSGATLQGMGLARNAIKMLNQRDNMRKKLSKIMKDNGHAPIKYDKEAFAIAGKIYDGVVDSGTLGAINEIKGLQSTGLGSDSNKDPYMLFTPSSSSSTSDEAQKKNGGVLDPFGNLIDDQKVVENVEEVLPTIDDYELNANSDIQDRPSASIFDIISVRYIKSGYPVLLKQRAPASTNSNNTELNQK
jgi:hypothetical protein